MDSFVVIEIAKVMTDYFVVVAGSVAEVALERRIQLVGVWSENTVERNHAKI
jgi:hypothetical protein